MALEDLLRDAAKRGITHLTVYPVQSEDGRKTFWCARATPSTEHKYITVTTDDPVEAVTQVLKALPKARTRDGRVKAVTAAVIQNEIEPERPDLVGAIPTTQTETVPEAPPAPPPLNLDEEFASWLPKP